MYEDGNEVYQGEMVEPEMIAYSIDDCILPAFHPPPPLGRLWPEGVTNRLIDVSTALVYLIPGLLAVCTVGNLVSIIVLKRLYSGVLSTGLYVLLSLFVDILVMWSRCGVEWVRLATNTNVREVIVASSLILCKIYPFISNTILLLSSWLMVAMAVETAWVHQHPQRLMRVCKIGRARLVVLAVVFLSVSVNCPSFWTYSLYTSPVVLYTKEPKSSQNIGEIYDDKSSGEMEDDLVSTVQEKPTCANEIMDERLLVAAAATLTPEQLESFPGLDYRKALLMSVNILMTDFLPYFIVFSCSVMLVTKRLRRKDQVRQIDNTWKACNVDSGVAHQLHTTFICLCLAHTILLFPKLVYKTFLLVTDPQVTGLVPYPVEHRPCTVVAKTICYLLHYAFLTCKLFVFLGSSTAFRGECFALITCNSTCEPTNASTSVSDDHVSTGLPLLHNNNNGNNNNNQHHNECTTVLETTCLTNISPTCGSTSIAPTSATLTIASLRSTPNNYLPHPPLPNSYHHGTFNRAGKSTHAIMNTNTLPLHRNTNASISGSNNLRPQLPQPQQLRQLQPLTIPEVTFADDVKPEDPAVSSATIMENGAPCIKIFSMTSV